jgi:hypothetical protein
MSFYKRLLQSQLDRVKVTIRYRFKGDSKDRNAVIRYVEAEKFSENPDLIQFKIVDSSEAADIGRRLRELSNQGQGPGRRRKCKQRT